MTDNLHNSTRNKKYTYKNIHSWHQKHFLRRVTLMFWPNNGIHKHFYWICTFITSIISHFIVCMAKWPSLLQCHLHVLSNTFPKYELRTNFYCWPKSHFLFFFSWLGHLNPEQHTNFCLHCDLQKLLISIVQLEASIKQMVSVQCA